MRDKCDEKQEVLEEQLSYMAYMDTEYDVRPWKPADGVVEVAESDGHKAIKTKLDTEVSVFSISEFLSFVPLNLTLPFTSARQNPSLIW